MGPTVVFLDLFRPQNISKTSRIYLILINKKGHPLRVEDTYIYGELYTGTFHRDCVLASFCECRRHYSSWGVSRESQSSSLRFFVESIATDHQEVSSFFSDKKPEKSVLSGLRTRDLEPRSRVTCQPATVTYLFYYYYLHYL